MNRAQRSLTASLFLLVLCESASAQLQTTAGNPYRLITVRNVFGLRAPPPPAAAKQTPVAAPQIILNGLSTITGRKLALLKLEFPAKPAQKQREELCILKEGEEDGPVRVLQIDMKAQTVKVDNSGTIDVLTFDKNGPKSSPPVTPRRWAGMPVSAMRQIRR